LKKPIGYTVLPSEVRYDEKLSWSDKVIYAELLGLSHEKGYCYASNKALADLYGTSISTIQRALESLENNGWLERELIYEDGTNVVKERRIFPLKPNVKNDTTLIAVLPETSSHSCYDPHGKSDAVNNKDLITNLITKKNTLSVGTDSAHFSEIVDYLNLKTGQKFKATSKATQTKINARLKEGFTVEDFKTVIDTKTAEWLLKPDMSQYLRPETLFGTKMESYLNQSRQTHEVPDGFYKTATGELKEDTNYYSCPF